MKPNLSRSFAFFIGLLAMSSPAWAIDIVTQRSTNKQHFGEIGAITKTELTIKPKTGDAVKIPANDIAAIKWDGEPAKLTIAKGDEERGHFDKAIDTYTEVQKDASGKLKTYLEFLISRTMAKQALEDDSKLEAAIKRLEAFTKAQSDHLGFFESMSFLGQLQGNSGDFAKAQASFESLGKAPWKDYQMSAKIQVAKMQLRQNDIDGALSTFDGIVSANAESDAEKAKKSEALAGKASCLVKQKKFDEAAKLIDEIIQNTSSDEDATMAEAYVRQGDCFQAQNKLKEAALAYLHVPVLYPKEKGPHAESLFHLVKISSAIGQPDRANEARDDLLSNFPNSEWAKKLGAVAAPAETKTEAPKEAAEKDAAEKKPEPENKDTPEKKDDAKPADDK